MKAIPITALTGSQLGQIQFTDSAGHRQLANILSTGEVVPIPEPTTAIGVGMLLALVGYRERRVVKGWIAKRFGVRRGTPLWISRTRRRTVPEPQPTAARRASSIQSAAPRTHSTGFAAPDTRGWMLGRRAEGGRPAPAWKGDLRHLWLLVLVLFGAWLSPSLRAQTWNGGGTNDNWSVGNNWVGSAAPANDGTAKIIFAGSTRLTPNANANWDVLGILFTNGASAFTVDGSQLTIRGRGITNSSTTLQTINNNIVLATSTSQNWTAGASGGDLQINGSVSGSGSLTKYGSGTLTLTGSNSFTSILSVGVNGGVVNVRNNWALGATNGYTLINSGGAVQFQGGLTLAEDFSGYGDGIASDGMLRNISDDNTLNGYLELSGSTTLGVDAGSLTLGGVVKQNGGNYGFTKVGAGTLILSGANTFAGAVTISVGVVSARSSTALGTTAGGVTVASGAALQLQGGIAVGAEALTLNGSGIASDGALRNLSGNNSWSGAITLGSAATLASDAGGLTMSGAFANGGFLATYMGAGNFTNSGVISGSGGLTKNGSGTLMLSGSANNTLTGTVTVNDGTMLLNKSANTDSMGTGHALVIGDGVGAAGSAVVRELATFQIDNGNIAVTINNEGLMDLNGYSAWLAATTLHSGDSSGASITTGAGTYTMGGDLTLVADGAGTVGAAISGNLALGANRLFTIADGAAATDLDVSAVVSGAFTLTKAGAGTMVLSGANTYTHATTVSAGALNIRNATGLGTTAAGTTVSNGAALEVQGGIAVGAEALTINGSGISSGGALRNISGTNSWSGAVTLGSSSTVGSDADKLTLSGVVSGASMALTKVGSGTLELSGGSANTFSGALTVNDGTLLLNKTAGVNAFAGILTIGDGVGGANADVVQWSAANQIPTVTVTIKNSGQLDLNGNSDSVGALTMTGGSVTTGAGTLTLGGDVTGNADASTATISGNLGLGANRTFTLADGAAATDMQVSAVVSGGFTLTKDGAGTMVLSGANTYTGATTVSNGVLNIQNATGLGTTAAGTTVKSGAELQVQGTIAVSGEALTINGSGVSSGGALRNISGNNSWSGGVTLGSASTIASDSGTLTISGNITNGGFLTTVSGAGNVTASGVISGTAGLTKTGAGTLLLSGNNTFTGALTVSAGTLQLGASDRITDSVNVTLSGGTLASGGFNETVGTLTLTADSIIDFGSATSVVHFASISGVSWTAGRILLITNWTGSY